MEPVSGVPDWKARPDGPDYEATRQRLVDAAEAIVRDKGVGALRLDSVADAVDLHRSSVYRYFGSKEELITAVVVQDTLRIGRQVIAQLGASAAPGEFLVDGLVIALAEMAKDPVHQSLMAPSASEAMARVGGKALTEGLRPLVEPVFAAAVDQGVLRDGVTPDDAMRWLQIVASGLVRQPNILPEGDELADLLELMLVPALFNTSGRQVSDTSRKRTDQILVTRCGPRDRAQRSGPPEPTSSPLERARAGAPASWRSRPRRSGGRLRRAPCSRRR